MDSSAAETPSRQIRAIDPANGCEHTHTVILLHGRDSDCHDFASEFFESEISEDLAEVLSRRGTTQSNTVPHPRTFQGLFPSFKWVFPGALPISSERFSIPLTQWFDIWSVENPGERPEIQDAGLRQSVNFITKVIADESQLVPRNRVYLGGISQGFVTAVAAYLAYGQGLGGLMGFSSWAGPVLASYGSLNREPPSASKPGHIDEREATPVFLAHAVDDQVVPVQNGRVLRDALRKVDNMNVEWHEYEHGGHWITEPEGVDDFVRFLRRTMK